MMNLQVFPIQEVGARESKNQNGIGIGVGADGDVMYTLQSGQVHGVAMPLKAKANSSHDDSHETYVAAPLTSAYAKSASDDNDGLNGHLIAFSSKDHGADAGEIAPTLRSQNFKDSHMNGGGQVAVAFDERNITSRENRSNPQPGDPCHTLHSDAPRLAASFGVRRLTPRECERLQGFPDDWTLYDANGKEISDSARYRMLGNAVAVPVARWIGERILKVIN